MNAEDPVRFLPGPGRITAWEAPRGPGIRVDAGYAAGYTVTPHYDSLMAKLIVHGADREQTLARARAAVAGFRVEGPKCNLAFFAELLDNPEFVSGDYDTGHRRPDARLSRMVVPSVAHVPATLRLRATDPTRPRPARRPDRARAAVVGCLRPASPGRRPREEGRCGERDPGRDGGERLEGRRRGG